MTHPSSPASGGNRAGRQLASNRNKAAALRALQQQAAQAQASDLHALVDAHLRRQRHYGTTADLIDLIIERYPSCPKFASLLVDRLLSGDEALANALKGLEGA